MSDIVEIRNKDSHSIKRRRSSSNGDTIKLFESLSKTLKKNNAKRIEAFQQVAEPQSEIQLYFGSICKTVEKFTPIDQAKIKIEISRIVSQFELAHLEKLEQSDILMSFPISYPDDDDNIVIKR